MADAKDKSIMRCVGEFFAHIGRAIKTRPTEHGERREIRRTTEEHQEGEVTLRRTTIEEIEFKSRSEHQEPND